MLKNKNKFFFTLQLIYPTTASCVARFVPHLIVCLPLSNQNESCVYVLHCPVKTSVFMSCIVQSKPALCDALHCPVKTSVLFSLFSVSISFQNAGSPLASDHFDGLGVIPGLK